MLLLRFWLIANTSHIIWLYIKPSTCSHKYHSIYICMVYMYLYVNPTLCCKILPVCCAVLDTEKKFMEAAKRNDVETMKTLGKRLNPNAKNVVGLSREILYLHLSILRCVTSHRQTQRQVISGILQKSKWIMYWLRCLPQHDRTALHYAVAGKNREAVQLLLQRRVKVDQKDKVTWLEMPASENLSHMAK